MWAARSGTIISSDWGLRGLGKTREARSRWLGGRKSKCFEQIMWELEMASSRMSSIIVIRLSMLQTSLQSEEVSSIDPVIEDNHSGAGNDRKG